MPKKRFVSGIIDPITLIGVLFLIITLSVGTYVTKNRQVSLDINERASCMTNCMRQVGDSDECSNACGADRPTDRVTAPEPPARNDREPVDDRLEEEEVEYIQEVITAPVVINNQVVNQNTNINPVQEEPVEVTPPEVPVVNPPPPVVQPKTCDANGAQYPEDSVVVYGGTGSYRKCVDGRWVNNCSGSTNTVDLCEITDLTPNFVPVYLGGQYQAAMEQQEAQSFNQLDPIEAGYIQNIIDAETKTQAAVQTTTTKKTPKQICLETEGNAWVNNSCVSNTSSTNAFTDMVGGSGATVNLPPDPQTLLTNMLPSLDQALGKLPGLEGINTSEIQNFNYPIQNQVLLNTPNYTSQWYDFLTNIPLVGNRVESYIQSYADGNVSRWQELGYSSSKEAIQKCIDANGVGAGYSCMKQMTALGQEEVTSSTNLGTDIASVITLPLAPAYFGTKSLLMLGLGTFGGTMTVQQSKNAVIAQIEDPGFFRTREDINPSGFWETIDPQTYLTDAGYQTTMAGLGWLNLGTADKLIRAWGPAGNAAAQQTARVLNTTVSGINLAVDTPYAVNTCTEAGLLTSDCAFAGGVLATDIIFGGLDYYQGQLTLNPIRAVTETIDAIAPSLVNVNRLATNPLNEINIPRPAEITQQEFRNAIAIEQDLFSTNLDIFDPTIRIRYQGQEFTANSIREAKEIATQLTGSEFRITPEMHITEPDTLIQRFNDQNNIAQVILTDTTPARPNVLDNINEGFSNFWQNNIYSWETGFLPNWTNVGTNPIANAVFGNPRNILADLPTPNSGFMDWVNNTIGDSPIINRLIGRPEDISLKPNEVATDELIQRINAKGLILTEESNLANIQEGLEARKYVFKKTSLSDVVIDADGNKIDSYEVLLEQVQAKIRNGQSPLEAVNNTLLEAKQRAVDFAAGEHIDLNEIEIMFIDKEGLSSRILCGTSGKIDCLETPIIQDFLLFDAQESMGFRVDETAVIIGFGGNKGKNDFSFRHGALVVGDQIVGYNLIPRPISVFQRYANVMNWGEFFLTQNSAEKVKTGIDIIIMLGNKKIDSPPLSPSAGVWDGVRDVGRNIRNGIGDLWQRTVRDLNFRGLGNDQTIAPRSPNTNNIFDNVITEIRPDNTITNRWTRPVNGPNDPKFHYNVQDLTLKANYVDKNFSFDPQQIKILGTQNIDGRITIEIETPDGERFLMYRSTGTGAKEYKQAGDWQLINAFAHDGSGNITWFIKDVETTQFTKEGEYGKRYFIDLANYLKNNENQLLGNSTNSIANYFDRIGNSIPSQLKSNRVYPTILILGATAVGVDRIDKYLEENYGIDLVNIDKIKNFFIDIFGGNNSATTTPPSSINLDQRERGYKSTGEIIIKNNPKTIYPPKESVPNECSNLELLNTSVVGANTGIRYDESFVPDVVAVNDKIEGARFSLWTDTWMVEEAIEPVQQWVSWINEQGYSPFISSAYRSYETQDAYSSSYGNEAATAGGSCHQSGLCFDVHYFVNNETGELHELCYDPNRPECKINIDAQNKAQELGIAHPYEWDQPHYFVAVAASPAILPFVQQQSIRQTYIDQLNDELLKLQSKCNQYVSAP